MTFDYAASAELFMPKRKLGARQAVSYRRFTTAAEAIRCPVVQKCSPASRWMLASLFRLDQREADSPDIQ